MATPKYDNAPDAVNLDAVDVLSAGKSVMLIHDTQTSTYRPLRATDLAGLGGSAAAVPGTGPVLLETSAVSDTTARQLTDIPASATYAQLSFRSSGSYRTDATAATGSPVERLYTAGGVLTLTSTAELNGLRYLGTGSASSFSIVYRSF